MQVRLHVEGMDCASFATKIENALQGIDGVSDVGVHSGKVTIFHGGTADEEGFRDRIDRLGLAFRQPTSPAKGSARPPLSKPGGVATTRSASGIPASASPPSGFLGRIRTTARIEGRALVHGWTHAELTI